MGRAGGARRGSPATVPPALSTRVVRLEFGGESTNCTRSCPRRGHDEARPLHGFALQAVGTEGATVSELGRRLNVTKQAAAKTAPRLEQLGYLVRSPDPDDARAMLLRRSGRGDELLALSAEIFGRLRARLVGQLGAERVRALEDDLGVIAGAGGWIKIGDLPGWLRERP